MSVLVFFFLTFWFSCVHSGGDGKLQAPCGNSGDAPCGTLLRCNETTKKCGGTGELGAHCGGTSDLVCSELACDGLMNLCRVPNTGLDGQRYDSGDTKCANYSDPTTKICRSNQYGMRGQGCNTSRRCDEGSDSVCDVLTQLCREPVVVWFGSPNGAKCNGGASNKQADVDSICGDNLVCDTTTYTCRTIGNGNIGSKCGGIRGTSSEPSCTTGSCDSDLGICRSSPYGQGNIDEYCSSSDAKCKDGYACDKGTYKCREAGQGEIGSLCTGNGDKPCTADSALLCDQQTGKCRVMGHGGQGDHCDHITRSSNANYNDEWCKADLTCNQNLKRCVASGTLGGVCREANPRCDPGSACRDGVTCVEAVPGAEGGQCLADMCWGDLICGKNGFCSIDAGSSVFVTRALFLLIVTLLACLT